MESLQQKLRIIMLSIMLTTQMLLIIVEIAILNLMHSQNVIENRNLILISYDILSRPISLG